MEDYLLLLEPSTHYVKFLASSLLKANDILYEKIGNESLSLWHAIGGRVVSAVFFFIARNDYANKE